MANRRSPLGKGIFIFVLYGIDKELREETLLIDFQVCSTLPVIEGMKKSQKAAGGHRYIIFSIEYRCIGKRKRKSTSTSCP